MAKLHLFCPENDLALARNLAHYTPPPAAARLKSSGECLPLWFGDPGDRFVSSGINARWLDGMQASFGMDVQPFDYRTDGLTPTPWGWSKASRLDFERLGFAACSLPSDSALECLRLLSHRRTAAQVANILIQNFGLHIAPAAVEIKSDEELEAYLATDNFTMFKLPWSSSGRGLIPYSPDEYLRKLPQLKGVIARQGSIMAEQRHSRRSDFAMLYHMAQGKATPAGISFFTTDASGAYTGNVLMPQERITEVLAAQCHRPTFEALEGALGQALEKVIGSDYEGPLGVDMMTIEGSNTLALCEINLRNTMGHVATTLYSRYIHSGAEGVFAIAARTGQSAAQRSELPQIINAKLRRGTLFLNAPGSFFDIYATVK